MRRLEPPTHIEYMQLKRSAYMKRSRLAAVAFVTLMVSSAPALAGPYGDSLSKCLLSSTTSEQKASLVQWIFAVMALHHSVKPLTSITDEQRTEMNKKAAQVFQDLLTVTCKTETVNTLRYEGTVAIQTSFSALGQVAMRELMTDPQVSQGIEDLTHYLDKDKLEALGKEVAQPPEPESQPQPQPQPPR